MADEQDALKEAVARSFLERDFDDPGDDADADAVLGAKDMLRDILRAVEDD